MWQWRLRLLSAAAIGGVLVSELPAVVMALLGAGVASVLWHAAPIVAGLELRLRDRRRADR